MLLTKTKIFEAQDITFEDVEVPEWGGVVRVRGINGLERDQFEASIAQQNNGQIKMNLVNIRAKLVSLAVVDEAGQRLFSDRDVAQLGQKSARALDRVFGVAQRLAGLSKADLEELTENFTPALNGDSISG